MASLALLVSLMLLFVILLGPATWLLSKSEYIPRELIWFMGLFSIGIGLYWFFLPVNFLRFFGLLTAYLGWLAISSKEKGLDSR
jgi:hypothetical protein